MESILKDFCELPNEHETKVDLIEGIIIKHFQKDLIDLSKDKVVNVRIQLADSFYALQEKYQSITDTISDQNASLQTRQALSHIRDKIDEYLNQYFYKVLRNLKQDPSECVTEYLHSLYVFVDDQDALSEEIGPESIEFEIKSVDVKVSEVESSKPSDGISPNLSQSTDQTLKVPTGEVGDDLLRSLSNTSDLLGSDSLQDFEQRQSLDFDESELDQLREECKEGDGSDVQNLADQPSEVQNEQITEEVSNATDDSIETV